MKPLCIDLFCGLGGWAQGFLAEGYDVIGFDIERHDYGTGSYPGQLVISDVLTLHGSQFKDAAVIVASPPCQAYSYRAMPWKRAKALPPPDNTLFDACFRIQSEACSAAGHHIPMVVENVCGAQKWVGRAKWHYGSYYLWGDVPALMPFSLKGTKNDGSGWRENGTLKSCNRMVVNSLKNSDFRFTKNGEWRHIGYKNNGGSWFNVAHNTTSGKGQNPARIKVFSLTNPAENGIKEGGDWWNKECRKTGMARLGSKSNSRKAASAMIAKIPLPLAKHIARVYKPIQERI